MSNLPMIINQLKSDQTNNILCRALGYSDVGDTKAIAEAKKYATSVLTTIESDPKLHDLDPKSVVITMIDAAKFKLEIDGRRLCYIVPYAGKATLQIGYKGYLAKLKEHFPDIDYTTGLVYDGDKFSISDDGGYQSYTHEPADPFRNDEKGLKGVFVCLKWGNSQKVVIVPMTDLKKMQSKSKGSVWSEWFSQMAIKSAIKRACKIHFASISTISEIDQYDNEHGYNLTSDKVFDTEKPSIVDNLNKQILDVTAKKTDDPELVIVE